MILSRQFNVMPSTIELEYGVDDIVHCEQDSWSYSVLIPAEHRALEVAGHEHTQDVDE
jgi:hypothetical protein